MLIAINVVCVCLVKPQISIYRNFEYKHETVPNAAHAQTSSILTLPFSQ